MRQQHALVFVVTVLGLIGSAVVAWRRAHNGFKA